MGPWLTLARLLRYLWPPGAWGMRARVLLAMACLALAKIAVVYVPIVYKQAVDALQVTADNPVLTLPVGLVLAYGAARVLSLVFGYLRMRHRSLYPSMLAHMLHNAITIAVVVQWPGLLDLFYAR